MRRVARLVLPVLVVVAGCAGVPGGTPTPAGETSTRTPSPATTLAPTPTTTATATRTATTTETRTTTAATATASPEPTPTDAPAADNPWGTRRVTVRVNNSSAPDRDWTSLVREALDFWNGNATRYAGHEVTFRLVGEVAGVEPADADVEVRVVDEVTRCGSSTDQSFVGCAPYPGSDGRHREGTQVVRLADGLADNTTVQVASHEFGHLLGVRHGEEPMPLMANATVTTRRYRVHVDLSGVHEFERQDYREQVRHALEYYAAGAQGSLPGGAEFVTVDDRERADIAVWFPEEPPCMDETDDGSCGWTNRSDPTAAFNVTVTGIDAAAVGWHVGYWLAFATGVRSIPPPFRDPAEVSSEERRSQWWETDDG